MPSQTGAAQTRLEELKKEIEIESRKLSDITSESERLESGNEVKRKDSAHLDTELEEKRKDLSSLVEQIGNLTNDYDELVIKYRETENDERLAQENVDSIAGDANELLRQISLFEADKISKGKEVEGLDSLLETKRGEYRKLTRDLAEAETKLGVARAELKKIGGKYSRFVAAIDNALQQFRVFEGRIGQLSLETGYMISYERPQDLLDNDEEDGQ